MTPRTERRRAEREVQGLEERVERLVALKRPIPDGLAMALKAARFRALQIGPVRRPKERPSISEASA
jgi:hypothetical protein